MDKSRSEILFSKKGIELIEESKVAVIGVGGVGGYAVEMLVRAGIEKITIVDYDIITPSNVNRQIIALRSTIGRSKVEVLRDRILDINSNVNVLALDVKVTGENIESLNLDRYDYVIDCIDSVKDKKDLIVFCKKHNINIISAMGAGNRFGIPKFEVMDIYKTSNDGLSKVMRKLLREENIISHTVVCPKETAVKTGEKIIGSTSYYPAMCGAVIAAYVINEILEGKDENN